MNQSCSILGNAGREVLSMSPDAVVIVDEVGNICDANDAAATLLAVPLPDLLHRRLHDLVLPGQEDTVAACAGLAPREHWQGTVTLRRGDGAAIAVDMRVVGVAEAERRVVIAQLREVPHPQLDAELGLSETRYRALVEHLPVVIYTLANDETQTTTYLSPQFESLTGYSPAEALGQARHEPWQNFVHPDDQERVTALATQSVRLAEPFRSEHRLLRRDGRYVWVRDECLPVFDTAGQLIAWQGIYLDISALKAVEQALAVSETWFRTAFENAPIGMALVHPEGSFLRGNRALCTMLGMTEEQLLQTTFQQVTHPGDLDRDLAQTRRAVAGEISTFALEKRYVRRDGQIIWVRMVTSLLRDEHDAPRYFITQIEDVTAQRDAAEALARERDLLHTLMDHLPDGIYVKDIQSRFLRLNPASAAILGIEDPNQALGKTDFDFFPESLARQFFADEQSVISTGQPLLNRLEPQQEGETAAWWLTSTVPVRDATGAVIGIVGAGRDITERLRTEAALQASETRQRALLAAQPDLMFRLDRAGTHLDYKADRLNDLLLPPQQFLGRTVAEVLPTDVATLFMQAIAKVLDVGGIETAEYALDFDNHREFFEARLVAAGPDEVVAIVRNVTERARAEAELRAAKEAAEKASHLKSAFLSTMSHEVRTPLTSIVGYTELLLRNPALNADLAEDVDHIARGSRHLLELVNDLLDLSRIEAGAMPLRIEREPVAEIVAEALTFLAPQIADKGLAVKNDVPAHVVVSADRQRLRQILLNLIGNAIKFTRVGTVTISAVHVAEQIQIVVTDTGIGIPAAALPRIFDEFRQADSSTTRRFGGAGLGLAIAKQLAELHGGHITATSEVDVGSTFIVHLPAG